MKIKSRLPVSIYHEDVPRETRCYGLLVEHSTCRMYPVLQLPAENKQSQTSIREVLTKKTLTQTFK